LPLGGAPCYPQPMLDRLRALIRGQAPAAAPGHDLESAAAGLMVEAAMMDGSMNAEERAEIEAALRRCFDLSAASAAARVEAAIGHAGSAGDFHGYSRALVKTLDHDARLRLIESLWRVVQADGSVCDFEANLLRRAAGLLNVEDRDSGAARKRAATT
jgi:uncharacterized tellurite resistance protein B-like protein